MFYRNDSTLETEDPPLEYAFMNKREQMLDCCSWMSSTQKALTTHLRSKFCSGDIQVANSNTL